MSDLETSCRVLEDILKKKGKYFVCPLCRSTYSRADAAFKHCRDEGAKEEDRMSDTEKRNRAIHEDLGAVTMGGSFRKFQESLAIACGRSEIPIAKLPLHWTKSGRRSYGSCLGAEFIVEIMATSTATRFEILKGLVHDAGIHCVCPSCWTGFAKSEHVTEHCALEMDENHQGLLSNEAKPFMELYGELLEQKVNMVHMELYGELLGQKVNLAHVEVGFDRHGVPDFHRCFGIDKILRHLSTEEDISGH